MNELDILAFNGFRMDTESFSTGRDFSCRCFAITRVLFVRVVLAYVNDRHLPEGSHVHPFVKQPLPDRPLAEKADRHLIASTHLGRHRRASGDSSATSDDSVRSKVAGILIRDVHRPAFAATIARGFPEQLGKHLVYGCALGEAMAVAAVRTRN